MQHTTLRGEIGYFGENGEVTGREWFNIAVQPDGSRTLIARCEMDDDEVLRDVILALDSQWRPLDLSVRLSVERRFQGSGWIRAHERGVEMESYSREHGRLSQFQTMDRWPAALGSHSLVNDCWKLRQFDRTRPHEDQTFTHQVAMSMAANGATGPLLSVYAVTIRYIGEERRTVPAGTFETLHFAILFPGYPPLDCWVMKSDYTFVRQYWTHLKGVYELTAFEKTEGRVFRR
jgi:hypothetical protein